jgi:CRP/FNR family cyclic AMP-dependent transcriptional regulator
VVTGAIVENLEETLKQSLFLSLLPEEVAEFKILASMIQVMAGGVIFKEEDSPDYVYLIKTGHIKIYRSNPLGKVVTVGFRGPGDLIGMAEVLTGMNRCCFAEAVESCELWRINGEAFISMLHSQSGLVLKVAAALGSRLRDAETAILNLVTLDVDRRLAKLLLSLAKVGVIGNKQRTKSDMQLTHQELANMIGTSRQTVTTILRRFKEEKLVFTGKQHIEIVDWNRLNSFANQKVF